MSEGEGPRPPHVVLLRSPAGFDPVKVCAVVSARTAIAAETLLPVLRRGWGILAEPHLAEGAEAMAAALAAAGQPAVAAPSSLVEDPPKAVEVTKAELAGDGFDVLSGRAGAAPERHVWTRLRVLSAGAVAGRSTKTVTEGPSAGARAARIGITLATGIPLGAAKGTTRRVEEETRVPFVELLFGDPARRLRLLAADFDYNALGPKMTYSAELNFRALVSALAAAAPGALRSRGARAILAKAHSGASAYDSFDDVTAELRWLGTLVALKAAV